MIRPLTLRVSEQSLSPEAFGRRRADELFSMLDELTEATLQRVGANGDAQFVVELAATPDARIGSVLLRESIVVIAVDRIAATDDVTLWETIANRYAKLIDAAAECYAETAAVLVS